MTDIPKGFVPVKQVSERFNTSRSSLDRRRAKAQQGSDQSVLKQFLLRTRDGVVHESASREQVQQFIKTGMVPEWFVSTAWVRKQYGERKDKEEEKTDAGMPSATPTGNAAAMDAGIAALKQQYEERIGDLKLQLQQEREEKRQLLQYAQHDKQLFGNAVSNLTKVLTLPGVAGAIDTANRQLTESAMKQPSGADRGESVSQAAPPKPASVPKPPAKSKPRPPQKKGWFSWGRR